MKKQTTFRVIAAAGIIATLLMLSGCPFLEEEDTVSIAERVQFFVQDLNGNYNQVYLNWHPDTTTRQAAANPTTLQTRFPSSEVYTVSGISANEALGTATATIDSDVTFNNANASFRMKKDGDNWFIDSLTVSGVTLNSVE